MIGGLIKYDPKRVVGVFESDQMSIDRSRVARRRKLPGMESDS